MLILNKIKYLAKIPYIKIIKTISFYVILVILADSFILVSPVQAGIDNDTNSEKIFKLTIDKKIGYYKFEKSDNYKSKAFLANNTEEEKRDKSFEKDQVKWTGRYVMTAYNSEPGQTDSTPCITANGFNVCEHGIEDTVAANFLYFGSKVRIPELFGDKIFIVRDRMNRRFDDRVDVWMLNKQDALKFGKKIAKIEIIK